jgi:signal transduction histidine kinase/ligand-binding sensor domain-containing protein
MTARRRGAWLLVAFISLHVACAQVLPVRTFTVNDGLPSNQIRSIVQDGHGYLWVGTYAGGVSTYDGTTFRTLITNDGLPSSIVWSLAASRRSPDVVWLGTWGGLYKATGTQLTRYLAGNAAMSRTLFAVYEDFDGTVWCGTARGVQRLMPNDSMLVAFSPDTSFGHVVGICQRSDSTIYIGSWNGLWSHKRGRGIERLDLGRNTLPEVVLALYVDRHDTLWVSRRDRMVLRYFRDSLVDSLPIPNGYFHQIAEDADGDLWLASSQGVARIVGKRLSPDAVRWYNVENGLPESTHRSVFVDREANVWLGATFKGLSRLSSLTTITLPLTNIPDHPSFASCVQDSRGHFWIASTNGMWEVWETSLDAWEKEFHHIGESPYGSSVSPRCIDSQDNLWVSIDGGLLCYRIIPSLPAIRRQPSRLKKVKMLRSGTDIPTGRVLRAVSDRKGMLWVSISATGLIAVQDAMRLPKVVKPGVQSAFPDSVIRTLFVDSKDRVWMGGTDRGVAVLHKDGNAVRVSHLDTRDGLPENHVRAICESSDGMIWVGAGGGVVAVSPTTLQVVTSLPSDTVTDHQVFSMLPATPTEMWLGTTQGLRRYQVPSGVSYDAPDFARIPVVAMGYTQDARMWCLGYDGLRIFQYTIAPRSSSPPPIFVIRLDVNDRTINLPSPISTEGLFFSHNENNCTIEYGGISLRDGAMLQYKYHLSPVDKEWHGPTPNRMIAFPALLPGTYTFEVMAINAAGLQSLQPASLSFTIRQPFWQTWWFLGLTVAAVAALLVLGYNYRVRRLLELERLRLKISADLHDELASNLSSIALFGSILRSGSSARNEHPELLERMTGLAHESLAALRHIIWAIDPKVETLADLLVRLRETMSGPCRAKNMFLRVDGPLTEHQEVSLGPEQRQHLWLMLKEAITNAIKHSGATELTVTVEKHGGMLRIEVRDNGCGFDGKPQKGKGLGTMRMRAEQLKGTATVDSSPGQGTRVVFQVRP